MTNNKTETSQKKTAQPKPIAWTYKCPCGVAPKRGPWTEKFLAYRAMENHAKHNNGQRNCRKLKQELVDILPPVVA